MFCGLFMKTPANFIGIYLSPYFTPDIGCDCRICRGLQILMHGFRLLFQPGTEIWCRPKYNGNTNCCDVVWELCRACGRFISSLIFKSSEILKKPEYARLLFMV